MTVTGQIYDNQNMLALPGASVTLVNAQGTPVGGGTSADSNGIFTITSPDLDTGGKLMVSYVGYTSVIVDPAIVVSGGVIGLDQDNAALPAATVTAARKKNYTPLVLGGAGLLLLASTSSRKKKRARMGAIGTEWADIGIKAGIAVGAYFLIVKPVLTKLGVFNSATTQATLDAQKQSLAEAKAKQPASYTADQYMGWANDIYAQIAGGTPLGFIQQSQIVTDIVQADNMTDLQSLISAFGLKDVAGSGLDCTWLGINCQKMDLETFVKTVLDGQHLSNLNQYLSAQNIKYQF